MSQVITGAISPKSLFSGAWDVRRITVTSGIVLLLLIAGGMITLLGEKLLGGSSANELRIATFQDWRVVCPAVTLAVTVWEADPVLDAVRVRLPGASPARV